MWHPPSSGHPVVHDLLHAGDAVHAPRSAARAGWLRRSPDAHAEDLSMAVGTDVVRPGGPDRMHPRDRGAVPLVGTRRFQPVLPLGADGMGACCGVHAQEHLETGTHRGSDTDQDRAAPCPPPRAGDGAPPQRRGRPGRADPRWVWRSPPGSRWTMCPATSGPSRRSSRASASSSRAGTICRPTTGAGRRAIRRADLRAAAGARRPASCGPRSWQGPRGQRPGPPRWFREPAGRSR